jgi:hypothetical protein
MKGFLGRECCPAVLMVTPAMAVDLAGVGWCSEKVEVVEKMVVAWVRC